MLKVLEQNRTLVKLKAENNKFRVTRGLLAVIGNVFVYRNRTLKSLILTTYGKRKNTDEDGEEYDRDMIMRYMNEMK